MKRSVDNYIKEHIDELKKQIMAEGLTSEEAEAALQVVKERAKRKAIQEYLALAKHLTEEKAWENQGISETPGRGRDFAGRNHRPN